MTTRGRPYASVTADMSHSIKPLPQHPSQRSDDGGWRVVVWFMLIGVAFWPRLWIVGFWIFGGQLGNAFSGWVVPTLGFFLLPWTTLLYAWMWGINSDGVFGWEWAIVGMAFLLDVIFWAVGRRSVR